MITNTKEMHNKTIIKFGFRVILNIGAILYTPPTYLSSNAAFFFIKWCRTKTK